MRKRIKSLTPDIEKRNWKQGRNIVLENNFWMIVTGVLS